MVYNEIKNNKTKNKTFATTKLKKCKYRKRYIYIVYSIFNIHQLLYVCRHIHMLPFIMI